MRERCEEKGQEEKGKSEGREKCDGERKGSCQRRIVERNIYVDIEEYIYEEIHICMYMCVACV